MNKLQKTADSPQQQEGAAALATAGFSETSDTSEENYAALTPASTGYVSKLEESVAVVPPSAGADSAASISTSPAELTETASDAASQSE